MLTVKKLALSTLITSSLLFYPALHSLAETPQHVVKQPAGGYSVQVGNVLVTSFTDGSVAQDLHALLRRTTEQKTDALLAKNFQANPVEVSINAFLIALPGHKILVDTGSGQLFGPGNGGRLIESLATQGIKPQDITEILLTHAHSDHSGGLIKDGKAVFTNARVFVGKPDIDFFFNEENQKKTGYGQNYFDVAQKTLKPYLDAGKVVPFTGTSALLPGITGTVHPGHTPGSAFYTLESKGEKITFVGDIIHVAAVQFPQPDVTIAYDEDQDGAARVRKQAFDDFVKNRDLVAAPHLPFPGIGYVTKGERAGYAWVPVTYANRDASTAK
ncbi:MBL fold metallo-hydrolase [Enterobacter cloacae]|uniref:MBL fold metallo-hydrolase n=1 Tax=Enterobacter cloacae TaxID=550 RepID=UPI00259F809E|nr:MBL fold metallo-hydrolase [Enterobacter cloacae]EKV5783424.1 MBL fold metallo-hydrolase [Enterobacter cloacae]ELV2767009.1 MBL fold metallo-hydrolase [Enterobacter cloacae]ELV2779290.1 MBL fold metallo-hydrolase [Enterobacter cloacae]